MASSFSAEATANHLEVSVDELSFIARNNTAVSNIYSHGIQLKVIKNQLIIDGIRENVSIYNSNGQLVQSQKTSERFVSNSLHSGVYVVKVDGYTEKVVVR